MQQAKARQPAALYETNKQPIGRLLFGGNARRMDEGLCSRYVRVSVDSRLVRPCDRPGPHPCGPAYPHARRLCGTDPGREPQRPGAPVREAFRGRNAGRGGGRLHGPLSARFLPDGPRRVEAAERFASVRPLTARLAARGSGTSRPRWWLTRVRRSAFRSSVANARGMPLVSSSFPTGKSPCPRRSVRPVAGRPAGPLRRRRGSRVAISAIV
jgi:hypothetical protein